MESRIDFSDFRQLLQSLENSDILIRIRISGESWVGFSKLILLSDSAMILQDDSARKVIVSLRNVVEFELDQALPPFAAGNRYALEF